MADSSYNFGREVGRHWKPIAGVVLALVVALNLFSWFTPGQPKGHVKQTVSTVAAKPATPTKGDIEINIVLAGAKRLKESMKKPETFELLYAGMIDGKVLCYEYRARNSYNDRRVERYVVTDTVSSSKPADWNKFCAGKDPTDYSAVRSVL